MRVELIRGTELTAEHDAAWNAIVAAEPALDSPYFRPEFTRAVARVCSDVKVAVWRNGSEIAGLFPFHRDPRGVGQPVARNLSDFHGVIARADAEWSATELVRQCGLSAWEFDHLLASQTQFAAHTCHRDRSPYLDLSGGFDAYSAERKQAGSSELANTLRKARKLEREIGPIRFQTHNADPAVFQYVLDQKSEQCRRTGSLDVTRLDWVRNLLADVANTHTPEFSGVLSTLHAGDSLLAAHLGMMTDNVLHWWFPTYSEEHGKYSPGLILLVELAKHAAANGITRIDLGKGPERYKASFMSGAIDLCEGAVDRSMFGSLVRRGWYRTRDFVRSTPLRGAPLSAYRRIRNALKTRQVQT